MRRRLSSYSPEEKSEVEETLTNDIGGYMLLAIAIIQDAFYTRARAYRLLQDDYKDFYIETQAAYLKNLDEKGYEQELNLWKRRSLIARGKKPDFTERDYVNEARKKYLVLSDSLNHDLIETKIFFSSKDFQIYSCNKIDPSWIENQIESMLKLYPKVMIKAGYVNSKQKVSFEDGMNEILHSIKFIMEQG